MNINFTSFLTPSVFSFQKNFFRFLTDKQKIITSIAVAALSSLIGFYLINRYFFKSNEEKFLTSKEILILAKDQVEGDLKDEVLEEIKNLLPPNEDYIVKRVCLTNDSSLSQKDEQTKEKIISAVSQFFLNLKIEVVKVDSVSK